jgi:hypothetical protein
MLEACHLYCDHGYVKIYLKRVFSTVEYGEQFARPHQASSIKKDTPSWEGQDRHHLAKVECARQSMFLDMISSYQSHGVLISSHCVRRYFYHGRLVSCSLNLSYLTIIIFMWRILQCWRQKPLPGQCHTTVGFRETLCRTLYIRQLNVFGLNC